MDADGLRRAALSRARQIANQAKRDAEQSASLHGVAPGDVLDYVELHLFVAVTGIAPGGMHALGVRQEQPWAALKDVRMPSSLLELRLSRRWLKLVPHRHR